MPAFGKMRKAAAAGGRAYGKVINNAPAGSTKTRKLTIHEYTKGGPAIVGAIPPGSQKFVTGPTRTVTLRDTDRKVIGKAARAGRQATKSVLTKQVNRGGSKTPGQKKALVTKRMHRIYAKGDTA